MGRPKLRKDQKRVSVSFTMPPEFNVMLLEEIPEGQRSEWICGVVISALKEFKEFAGTDFY